MTKSTNRKQAREPKGRRVRCAFTGEYGLSTDFYRDAQSGRYYKSRAVFDEWRAGVEARNAIKLELVDILGLDKGMILSPVYLKYIKEAYDADPSVTLQVLKENRESIEWALRTKRFGSDVSIARYIAAIVKNHYNEVYLRLKREKKKIEAIDAELESFEAPKELSEKQKEINSMGTTKRSSDVSGLLGGDDDWI